MQVDTSRAQSILVKRSSQSFLRRQWPLYVMMLAPLTFFIVFKYFPMAGVVVAFKDYNMFIGVWASDWVGLDVFREIFALPQFYRAVRNTLMLNLLALFTFPVPIILAIMS